MEVNHNGHGRQLKVGKVSEMRTIVERVSELESLLEIYARRPTQDIKERIELLFMNIDERWRQFNEGLQ